MKGVCLLGCVRGGYMLDCVERQDGMCLSLCGETG